MSTCKENCLYYPKCYDFGLDDECSLMVDCQKECKDFKDRNRFVELPCKVGDVVYTIGLDCKDNPDHNKMCFCLKKSCKGCEKSYLRIWEDKRKTQNIRGIVENMMLCGESYGFGKTVFLTKEDAQAELARLEGRNEIR